MNYLAIVVAAVAAFVFSSAWYAVFGQELAKLHAGGRDQAAAMASPPAWKLVVEFLRSLTVAFVLARFAALVGVHDWKGALELGLLAWLGFSAVLWVGAVMWENLAPRLAAIHAGDWLVKALLIALIVGLWRQ
jgi:hypothetical protein